MTHIILHVYTQHAAIGHAPTMMGGATLNLQHCTVRLYFYPSSWVDQRLLAEYIHTMVGYNFPAGVKSVKNDNQFRTCHYPLIIITYCCL